MPFIWRMRERQREREREREREKRDGDVSNGRDSAAAAVAARRTFRFQVENNPETAPSSSSSILKRRGTFLQIYPSFKLFNLT